MNKPPFHSSTMMPPGVPVMPTHTYVLMTYLNPIDIPAGEAVMMLAPDQFKAVERIPDWYWTVEERQLGFTNTGLVGDQILGTYFTCRRTADGMMFKTVMAHPDVREYVVVDQSQTHAQALEAHAYWKRKMALDPAISGVDPSH